jgi:hypothetical protein
MGARPVVWLVTACLIAATGCYYKPEHKRSKAHPDFLSEAEAEGLVQKRLARYGVKFISNMNLEREGIAFVADGYDRDLRVGFEYRSHEGRDFEDEEEGNAGGLSGAEIEALHSRQEVYREFFLIIPEGTPDSVEQAVDKFVKDLYGWEVLKKKKIKKADNLFPDQKKKGGEALPWEATGDLKTKREQMEQREADRKASGDRSDDEDWQTDDEDSEPESGDSDDGFSSGEDDKPAEKTAPKKPKKPKKPGKPKAGQDDDVWNDGDEDF